MGWIHIQDFFDFWGIDKIIPFYHLYKHLDETHFGENHEMALSYHITFGPKKLNFKQGLKSDTFAIFQSGLRWTCPVNPGAAIKNLKIIFVFVFFFSSWRHDFELWHKFLLKKVWLWLFWRYFWWFSKIFLHFFSVVEDMIPNHGINNQLSIDLNLPLDRQE